MPSRKIPLVSQEFYHVFNRGIDRRIIFTNKKEHERALLALKYYRYAKPPVKLSTFLEINENEQYRIVNLIQKEPPIVEIIAYCLMPNHFHLLLRQTAENGISQFVSNMENSYTRYFNTKHERKGPLFLNQFEAVRIETDEQLIHVSRYIHLNPYSLFVVRSTEDLLAYPWSSLGEYLNEIPESISKSEYVFSCFKDRNAYKRFVTDQADYQRKLDIIKHLLLEES